jgi:hypothetical protein
MGSGYPEWLTFFHSQGNTGVMGHGVPVIVLSFSIPIDDFMRFPCVDPLIRTAHTQNEFQNQSLQGNKSTTTTEDIQSIYPSKLPNLRKNSRQHPIQHIIRNINRIRTSIMLAPEPFIPRNTTMSIITTTIPLPILAKIFPIFIPGPFDHCPAINPDPDVVVCGTAERPASFPGAIPSDIEEVAG